MKNRVLSLILAAALLMVCLPLSALQVHAVNDFTMSDEMIEILKEFEGFSAKPYWDYGQWTVGYGTRAPSEHLERYKKEGISREEAEELLRDFLSKYGTLLNEFANKWGLELTQGQFDALLSLSFNCGPNWMNETSNFRSAVLEGRTGNEFLFAMGQWSTAGGEVQRGLVRRRLIEINIYLNGIYSMDVPENYDYVLYDANGGERDVKVQCYDSNLTDTPISVPTYEGYTFLGWYTAVEGGEKIELLDASVAGYKLYAHWSEEAAETPDTPEEITGTPTSEQRVVTADSIQVLEQPIAGSNAVSTVKKDAILQLTALYTDENGTQWGKTEAGWLPLSGTEPYEPDVEEISGIEVTVTASDVNIRKGPGTNYPRVDKVNSGDVLTIIATATGSGYTWGQFSGGWIALKYTNYDAMVNPQPEVPVQPVEPETPGPEEETAVKGTVDSDDGLRIRADAGTQYAIVGYLRDKAEVTILETKTVDGTPWGRMDRGWICMTYVNLDAQTEEPDTQDPVIQQGTVTGSNLRIRSGPSTAYDILGYLQIGDEVQITETVTTGTTQWGKTEKGWISMDYVKITGTLEGDSETGSSQGKPGTITGNNLRIRSGAGTSYEIVGYLNSGDRVEILEQTLVGSTTWGRIDRGWISMDFVQLDEDQEEEPLIATVIVDNPLRIREGAGSDFTVVGYLNKGDTVEILERKIISGTHWGRCSQGWINLTFVTLSDGSSTAPEVDDTVITGTVTATSLNVRKTPGTDGEIVAMLYQGDQVTILETTVVATMTWGRTELGWISMDYVQQ